MKAFKTRQTFKRQRECIYAVVINGATYAAFAHLNDAVNWAEDRYSHYPADNRRMIKIIDSYGDEFQRHAWPSTAAETLPRGDGSEIAR
jgi:hypothetical protein